MPWWRADLAHLLDVLQGDGLSAAAVVGDRHHDQRDLFDAAPVDEFLELFDVHVALERMGRIGIIGRGGDQVLGPRPEDLDVGPGRVEMDVVGNAVALLDRRTEEDPFRRPTLVGRDDVAEAEDRADRIFEMEEITRSGVGLVPGHDAGPLVVAHGRSPGVRQKVDHDLFGRDAEDVEPGLPEAGLRVPGARPGGWAPRP